MSDDRGSGTLLALVSGAVILAAGLVGITLIGISTTHQRLQVAADLSVLAAAQALSMGGDPCGTASRLATANDVQIDECRTSNGDAVVTVSAEAPGWVRRLAAWSGADLGRLRVSARAGPAE